MKKLAKNVLYICLASAFLVPVGSVVARAEAIYRVKTEIGGKVFYDLFTLPAPMQPIGKFVFSGTLTVPGIFTVPLQGQVVGLWAGEPQLSLRATAKEQGREYPVNYTFPASFNGSSQDPLVGTVSLDGGKEQGTVEATLIFSEPQP